MNILLTGGAGYIGSHTAVVLANAGHNVVILDNLCNSQKSVISQIGKITGNEIVFVKGDVRDAGLVEDVLRNHQIDAVIHLAGLKSVAESTVNPLLYFDNNVSGSVSLLSAMKAVGVKKLIFSSSATVYGQPQYLPYDEDHPTSPMNPYGWTKLQVEQILKALSESDPEWQISCLRYFNPVGAHESGLIGEDPNGIPNNLMPYICRVAKKQLNSLTVHGGDYNTVDGTGVRDYIHVMDLADGHLSALIAQDNKTKSVPYEIFNLGMGKGYSVLEMIQTFEQASAQKIPYKVGPRRSGDLPSYYSSTEKANKSLNWKAHHDLFAMCRTSWNFQSKDSTFRDK